jgi:hypothetical protein
VSIASLGTYRRALGAFVARLPQHLDADGSDDPAAQPASTLRDP